MSIDIPMGFSPVKGRGAESATATVTATSMPNSIDAALERSEALLKRCRFLMRMPQVRELFSLLKDHPILMLDISVREELFRLMRKGRLRCPAWPINVGYKNLHPIVVYYFVESVRGERKCSQFRAFEQLESELGLSFETLRRLYFEGKGDKRFWATAAQLSEATPESDSLRDEANRAQTLKPGGSVSAPIGPLTMRIEATPADD